VEEVQKSQALRLWDVLILGPALIWIASKENLSSGSKNFLIASGILIIAYNGNNYFKNLNN
jgi:hypothetical protein